MCKDIYKKNDIMCKKIEVVTLVSESIAELQERVTKLNSNYAILLPNTFSVAYDDALQDALSIIGDKKMAVFGTVYEAESYNKFDPNYRNPLLNTTVSDIVNHPGRYVACVLSKEVYETWQISGSNVYEALAILILTQHVDDCLFIPLNILTTPMDSKAIEAVVNKQELRNHFCATHPLLEADYRFLFDKQDIATSEENIVMEKLKKTIFFRGIMGFRKILHWSGYYKRKHNRKQRKYIQRVRKEDADRIADLTRRIEALPLNMLHAKGDDSDIVVSLTTHGKRLFESAPFGIYSLFTQTILPNRIVISVNQDDWNEDNLPPLIKRLQQSGLEVLFCRDVRSHTKLLPALANYPDNPIITVDDDMCYEPHMIEELLMAYKKSDKKTVLCRQGVYPKKKSGKYVPYMKWDDSPHLPDSVQNKLSHCVSPYGVYGVLYPPHIFDAEIFRDDIFLRLAPHTDDIWFWLQEVRCGIKAEVVRPSRQKLDGSVSLIEYLEESESSALYFQNCFGGRNDKEMYALLDYYHM